MRGPANIKDFSSTVRWPNRIPFCYNTTGLSTSTAYTGRLTIPEPFDAFWDTAVAAELRVTTFDGRTAIPFDDVSLNIAGRSGYLIVRPTVTTAAKMEVGWLYWGATGATDTSTTIADATAVTFYMDVGGPVPPFIPFASPLGATKGTKRQKQSGETVAVYFRLPAGQELPGNAAGWPGYEAPQHWSVSTGDPALVALLANTRIVQDAQRNLYLKALVAAGNDNTTDIVVDMLCDTIFGQSLIGTVSFDTEDLE